MLREALQRLLGLSQRRWNGMLYGLKNETPLFVRVNLIIVSQED